MMKNIIDKRWKVALVTIILLCLAVTLIAKRRRGANLGKMIEVEVSPQYGDIQVLVSTTSSVRPQNRLELKPTINGRIEEILVYEGDKIKKGDILAWMSSTDRAALLDTASTQGDEAIEYWQQVYKPTPLIAPIDGEVIVREVEPGQTVTSATAVLVLSDRLIVEAFVDETDIGRVKVGDPVTLRLDAYPLEEINGVVDHISHESKVINNVTMYAVEIVPDEVPEFLRSGMSADVDIIVEKKNNVLLIPREAVIEEDEESFVLLKQGRRKDAIKKKVELGISDENNIEVISGIGPKDRIIIKTRIFKLPKESRKSMFAPSFLKKKGEKRRNNK